MRGKRLISSLLSMAMLFSLNTGMSFAEEVPVTEEPVIEEQPIEEPAVEEVPIIEEEPEVVQEPEIEQVEEPADEYPAQTFTGTTPDGKVSVVVTADEGALPAGTKMYVYNVSDAEIAAIVDSVISGTRKAMVAANIIFLDKDGNEIEPLTDVTITLQNNVITEFENQSLVHINQANQADIVQDYQILDFTEERVVFTTDVFSIYAIVDSGDTSEGNHRATYEFLDQNGDPFVFYNNAGEEVHNQIIKDGEVLQNVGFPEIDVEHGPEVFNGWYYWNPDTQTFGDPVVFDTPISVTKTETIYIKANVGTVHYITFYEDPDGGSIYTKKQIPLNTSYDIAQQTLPSREGNLAFAGWSTEKFTGDDASQDTRTPITDTTITVTDNTEFYPIFKQAHWLTFVTSKTGAGAQYVASQYVMYDGVTQKPADPTWLGYNFDYWSTKPHQYSGEGPDTVIINDGSDGKFTFGGSLSEDTVLYAYWKPATVDYTIVYWKQNVTDNKNAQDAQKTYSYYSMETRQGTARQTQNLPDDAKDKVATDPDDYKGFKYNANKSDQSVVLNANGSSVLNVYYDRQTVKMQFYKYGNSTQDPGYNSDYWDYNNNRVTTFEGLYGQTLEQNGYDWPEGVWTYYQTGNEKGGMSYLGQFVLPDEVRDTNGLLFRAYKSRNDYNQTVKYYLEDINGGYSLDASGYGYNSVNFTFTEKYDGFEVSQYRRLDGNSPIESWQTAVKDRDVQILDYWTDFWGNVHITARYNLEIRYKRKTFNIHFLDSITNEELAAPIEVKYGASLNNIDYPDSIDAKHAGKEFNGKWYADKTCTTEFNWSTAKMPNGDVNVYAGWNDLEYWVKVDPNGGVINSTTGGATWFWRKYGETIEEYGSIQRNYVESPSGTFIYKYDEFNEKDPGGLQPETRYADYVSGSGSPMYKEEFGAYRLIGWYNVDPSSGQVTTPYSFGTGVTGNVYIRAVWRRIGQYKMIYDAGAGQHAPVDSSGYADGSDTAILDAPIAPAGYVFDGWEYDGKLYEPGAIVQVNAALANENKEILVVAKYSEYKDVPIKTTHMNWYSNMYDAAGLPIPNVDTAKKYSKEEDGIPYNEKVDIPDISELNIGSEYDDYTFLGWAKAPEGTTDTKFSENDLFLKYENGQYYAKNETGSWVVVENVGADENQPYEELYAVWSSVFYVYHSGVDGGNLETIEINKTNLPNGTYDLTQNLTADTIYGGYYLDQSLNESSPKYDGVNYTWSNPETSNGTQLVPKAKETYYIKEVPTTYLKPYYQYTYTKGTLKINNLYMMSAIDDLNYNETGFEIISTDHDANVYTSFTVKVSNGTYSTTFTPAKMFGGGLSGYVTAADTSDVLSNSSMIVKPYWVTPDGIKAYGAVERTITNGDGTINSFRKTDTVVGSSIRK